LLQGWLTKQQENGRPSVVEDNREQENQFCYYVWEMSSQRVDSGSSNPRGLFVCLHMDYSLAGVINSTCLFDTWARVCPEHDSLWLRCWPSEEGGWDVGPATTTYAQNQAQHIHTSLSNKKSCTDCLPLLPNKRSCTGTCLSVSSRSLCHLGPSRPDYSVSWRHTP